MKERKKTKKQPIDELKRLRKEKAGKVIPEKARDNLEKRISRLDHLYSALSKINEAIVRIKDPIELSREICRIAVEDGLFRMAWIGLNDIETNAVKPVAHWGHEKGYLKYVNISLSDTHPRGCGPTGAAARGVISVCDDFEHDPRMKPWRKEALKRGYRSSAAFPIGSGKKSIGALTLYSGEPNFFNKNEIGLIKALASNIYFAIEATRHEQDKKLAEEALKKERDFTASIVGRAGALIVVLDKDGRIEEFNRACEETTGYNFDEVKGKPFFDIFLLPEDANEIRKVFNNQRAGKLGDHDNYLLTKDGRRRLIAWRNTFLRDKKSKAEHIIAIGKDITDRKLAEDKLRVALGESQQRTAETAALLDGSRAILENKNFKEAAQSIFHSCKNLVGAKAGYVALLSHDGKENDVVYLDSGGMACNVDPGAGMPIRGFRAAAYKTGKTVFDNNFSKSKWVKYLPKGHVKLENVLFAPLMVEGQAVGLLGLGNKPGGFNDNDARMASAFGEFAAIALKNNRDLELLEHSEKRFRTVAHSAPNPFVHIDRNGKIVFWNKKAEEIFGYSMEEAIGKPVTLLMPERFREAHRKGIERLLATGESRWIGKTAEFMALSKNGSEFPIELSLGAFETKEGTYFTGISRDITERKQAEEEIKKHRHNLEAMVKERTEELEKSEIKYRNLFENMQVGMYRSKLDGSGYLEVNRKMAEVMGFKKEEMIGHRSDARFANIKERERMINLLREKGYVDDYEVRAITKTGEIKTVSASVRFAAEKGVIEGSMLDISDRKRAEERIKAEQKRFNDVLEMLPAYVVLLDKDYHVPFANRVFRERFGESHGKRCFEYLFNLMEPCENCETYKVLKTMAPHHWEWRGPDGRNYDIYDYPFTDTDGGTLILEVGIDITERKRAEEALHQVVEYNRSLIEASVDPLVTIGPDGKITDVNRGTEEITGYPREKLIGADFSDYFTEPGKARAGYKKVFDEGIVRDYELEIQHRDGHITPVVYNATVYKDEAGNVVGVFAAARDITRQILAEKAEREAERKLEEQRTLAIRSDRLRSLGEMAAGMAHELNQPLLGVRGLAEHILIAANRGWNFSEEKIEEKVKLIIEQADRMSYVIEHARMFARSARITELLPVNVNEVVKSSLSLVETQLKSHGYILDCQLAEGLPMVMANPYSLEEVVLNLISNARDALAEQIQESAKHPRIKLQTFMDGHNSKNWVVIQVNDSGSGIPEEVLEKVFDPFFTTKDADQGTGLGLSISKKIIEEFSGKIEIQSKQGVGTTVNIYLPSVHPASEAKQ